MLNAALDEAGIDRARAYVTNVVEQFQMGAERQAVSTERGRFVESSLAPLVTATVHPSSILGAPDSNARREAMRAFVNDLKKVKAKLL